MISTFHHEEALRDMNLEFDPSTNFFRDGTSSALVGFRQQAAAFYDTIHPSDSGTMGPGVYLGNTPESVRCFSRVPGMGALTVVELPSVDMIDVRQVNAFQLLGQAAKTAREKSDTEENCIKELLDPARLVIWKTQLLTNIGNAIFNRGRWPRGAHWGIWRDHEAPVKLRGVISTQ